MTTRNLKENCSCNMLIESVPGANGRLTDYSIQNISFPVVTYNLREGAQTSEIFYNTLKIFSNVCMDNFNSVAESILHQYAYFVTEDCKELPRSMGEYAVELLTIGIMWKRYSYAAVNTSKISITSSRILYKTRQNFPFLKNYIDPIRGVVTHRFLTNKLINNITGQTKIDSDTFCRLILWLDAAGEFKDEVKRFQNWSLFFRTITPLEVIDVINRAIQIANWFEINAKQKLGKYTSGVADFLKTKHILYRGREDELFCGKHEVEYFANMVASELMNHGLRDTFKQTPSRVVLVPGCMRFQPESRCKSQREGMDILCTGCTKECNVFRITQLGKNHGFKTCIVPHSSRFTQWLKKYQNSTEYGIVAIACPLNIAVGGYEMRELNIPSQCVMLDYCGCKKHWDEKGIATDVNDNQILQIVS